MANIVQIVVRASNATGNAFRDAGREARAMGSHITNGLRTSNAQLFRMNETLRQQHAQTRALRNQYQQAAAAVARLGQAGHRAAADVDSLEQQVRQADDEVDRLTAAAQALGNAAPASLTRELRDAEREANRLRGALDDAADEVRRVERQSAAAAASMRVLAGQINHTDRQIDQLGRSIRRLGGYSIFRNARDAASQLAGTLRGSLANGLSEAGGPMRDLAASSAQTAARWLAMLSVGVHLLPTLVDLAGIVQLGAAAAAAGGVAMLTLKLGMLGVSDALDAGLSGDMDEFNKALKKLTPSARDFVRSLLAVNSSWKNLKKSVQQKLFEGLGGEIRALSSAHLPSLSKWLPRIAGQFNEAAREVTGFFRTPANAARVEAIMRNVDGIIGGIVRVAKPLASILLDVTSVAAPRLASIADTTGTLAEKAAAWVHGLAEDGTLGRWLDRAIEGFELIFDIVGNLGEVLKNTYRAANDDGKSFLETLKEQTAALAEWSASANGQQVLSDLAKIGGAIIAFSVVVVQSLTGWMYVLHAVYEVFNWFLLQVLDIFGNILRAAAAAFGWVPGVGPKLQQASAEFDAFRDRANAALGGIQDQAVQVDIVTTNSLSNSSNSNSLSNRGKLPAGSSGKSKLSNGGGKGTGSSQYKASGGLASGLTMTGEYGRELLDLPGGTRVYNNAQTERMLAGGGQRPAPLTIVVQGGDAGTGPVAAMVELVLYALRTKAIELKVVSGNRVAVAA